MYVEDLGVDEEGVVGGWLGKEKGIRQEEGNEKQNDDISWKKGGEEKFGREVLVR